MRQDHSVHYEHSEEMCFVNSNCKKYKKRRNINSFNMADYRACDNCSNYTPDRKCMANSGEGALPGQDMW